ncbi:hypothetical protein AB5J55_12100 [Streptomyces sp. R11]|uniref:Uncharacterized protein n=1 Tax=Streptomyces sp. R11 TaxID=3238625 RepID=A0AB39MZ81_9ACTN
MAVVDEGADLDADVEGARVVGVVVQDLVPVAGVGPEQVLKAGRDRVGRAGPVVGGSLGGFLRAAPADQPVLRQRNDGVALGREVECALLDVAGDVQRDVLRRPGDVPDRGPVVQQ